jgi:predicted Rossmann fold flavoprotein
MKNNHEHFDLVVTGGGAAGFFCAINAAKLVPGLRVVILEKTGKLLQKVKVSGGGRCNTTHHLFELSALIKKYPRGEKFLKKALYHFGPADTISWFEERGVKLKTEADGRMFPVTDNSSTIIDCLMREVEKHQVAIWLHSGVTSVEYKEGKWEVQLPGERIINAAAVCIATGGFPKAEQYHWITEKTKHTIAAPVPSLFTFNTPGHSITTLMGVAHWARVKIAGTKFESEGPVLITHWGLSGPAVLRTSAFAARELASNGYVFEVLINWLPAFNENSLREKILVYRQEKGSKKVLNTEWIDLPSRLFEYLLLQSDIDANQRWADLPAQKQNRLIKCLCSFSIEAKGKTTFKEEFVTAGGIQLSEIDPNTMQSKLCPGLYFAGEIMDVDGITGGFNFQHAWTSGMIAARNIAKTMQ